MYQEIESVLTYIVKNLATENIDNFLVNQSIRNVPGKQRNELFESYNFMKEESHKYFEMAILLEGGNIIQIGQEYYTISKNQICIIDKNIKHRLGWNKSMPDCSSMLWIGITGETVRTSFTTYFSSGHKKVSGMDVYGTGEYFVNEICNELRTKNDGYKEAVSTYLSAFLTLLARRFSTPSISNGKFGRVQIVGEVKEYIKSHLDSHLTLQEISNKVYVSPNYLSTLFKQVTGQTITQYIHDLKIRRAAKLLKMSDLSLLEVAESLGFYDQFHFSKVFKSFTGISPAAYRNSMLYPPKMSI
jgi:AraC-like DNA-binding protein